MPPDAVRRCAITGTTGYIGAYLTRYLREQGMQITELRRSAPGAVLSGKVIPFTLGQTIVPDAFEGVDTLIHCAYDFTVNRWEDIKRINVDGTLRLFETAAARGVGNILFISTVSAFAGCRSLYGQAKFLVEQAGERLGVRSIRPGLVFDHAGPGGMVGALNGLMTRTALIPLIDNGEQILYPCHIDDLARMIYVLCTSADLIGLPSVITAASQPGMTFREILLCLAQARGKRIHFFSIPYNFVLFSLQTLERMGVKSRLRSDSLVSLLHQNTQMDFSGSSTLEKRGCFFRQMLVEDEFGEHYGE